MWQKSRIHNEHRHIHIRIYHWNVRETESTERDNTQEMVYASCEGGSKISGVLEGKKIPCSSSRMVLLQDVRKMMVPYKCSI
jgi:hypothetical protein